MTGTEVPVYPLGLPYLMAAFSALFGRFAEYAVTPVSFGMLVFLSGWIARSISCESAGIATALLVALDPAGILNSVWAMSDLPAAGCWIGAWWLVHRGRVDSAFVAGLLAAMAMSMRPVLAPLAAALSASALLVNSRLTVPSSWQPRLAIAFAVPALAGILLVAACQLALYGSPLRSGYPVESLFSVDHVLPNARAYPQLFVELHGGAAGSLLFVGVAALAFDPGLRGLLISGCVLSAMNAATYLPYAPFHSWPFLRFFFPATSVLFVLGPAGIASASRKLTSGKMSAALRWFLLAVIVAGTSQAGNAYRLARDESYSHTRVLAMGSYLREVLPENAVAIAYIHSGAIVHYAGRRTVRPETLSGDALDRLVSAIAANGLRPVLVLDENVEVPAFKRIFAGAKFGALDWAPRARFESSTSILYFDVTDRDGYLGGARWPVDVVRSAATSTGRLLAP